MILTYTHTHRYVHRLIQNTDGSLVELESSAATGSDDRRKRVTSQVGW